MFVEFTEKLAKHCCKDSRLRLRIFDATTGKIHQISRQKCLRHCSQGWNAALYIGKESSAPHYEQLRRHRCAEPYWKHCAFLGTSHHRFDCWFHRLRAHFCKYKLALEIISELTKLLYKFQSDPTIYSAAAPVTVLVIFAYLIVNCFMSVFDMTLNTIFICFCEDCEQNDGAARPYFMSPGLIAIMEELTQQDEPKIDAIHENGRYVQMV